MFFLSNNNNNNNYNNKAETSNASEVYCHYNLTYLHGACLMPLPKPKPFEWVLTWVCELFGRVHNSSILNAFRFCSTCHWITTALLQTNLHMNPVYCCPDILMNAFISQKQLIWAYNTITCSVDKNTRKHNSLGTETLMLQFSGITNFQIILKTTSLL